MYMFIYFFKSPVFWQQSKWVFFPPQQFLSFSPSDMRTDTEALPFLARRMRRCVDAQDQTLGVRLLEGIKMPSVTLRLSAAKRNCLPSYRSQGMWTSIMHRVMLKPVIVLLDCFPMFHMFIHRFHMFINVVVVWSYITVGHSANRLVLSCFCHVAK